MNLIRYYPIAGAAFLVLWVWKKRDLIGFRIQKTWPTSDRLFGEIRSSFGTLIVFSLMGLISIALGMTGHNRVYLATDKYGTWYLFASFILLTIWHETWFYWAHRAMHTRLLFKAVHLVHHKSLNPSPFAGYAFSLSEAVFEGIYLLIFTMVIPINKYVVIFHTFYAMIMNIWWHSGYEFFPSGFTTGKITRWINSSTHHNMHHSKTNCNYSLYFNFWDRICGTNHPEYSEYFESIKLRSKVLPEKKGVLLGSDATI